MRTFACWLAAVVIAPLVSTSAQAQYTYYVSPYAPTYPSMSLSGNGYSPSISGAVLPSMRGYVSYSIPGNYYQPTYQSYTPYAVPGATSGGGYPVYSIDYAIPSNGKPTTTMTQSIGSYDAAPGISLYYQAGYPGYTANSAYSNQSALSSTSFRPIYGNQNPGSSGLSLPSVPQPLTGLPAPSAGGIAGYGLPAPLPPPP